MILSTRLYKSKGYIIIDEQWEDMPPPHITMKSAYSWPDLYYIGNSKTAFRLNKRHGICEFYPHREEDYVPVREIPLLEKAKKLLLGQNTLELKRSPCCLTGWSEREQKWYAWARALHGFSIGSQVKKGDIAYSPANKQDFIENTANFWGFTLDGKSTREYIEEDNIIQERLDSLEIDVPDPRNEQQGLGVLLKSTTFVKDNRQQLQFTHWEGFPEKYGKGEWTAETLEDAKQMARDFAEGCA